MFNPYFYKAKVVSVYDGDTIRADIDLGFGVILSNQSLRLIGIDTPEIRGEEREEGLKVKAFVENEILNKEIWIETEKDKTGKYGRWLATIWKNPEKIGLSLNDLLLSEGMAEKYD